MSIKIISLNDKMNVNELYKVAKQCGVHGYSTMTKIKLIAATCNDEKQHKISVYNELPTKTAVTYLFDS